jgi:hypothetical protein
MKRLGILAVLTLTLVAALGATTLAARPATSFTAHAGHAAQGGSLHITARVAHPVRGTAFSASAVVHFSSGDVTVALKRDGRSFHAGTRVPVAADATLGPVAVDVTVTYGAIIQVVTVQGTIQPPDAV